MSFASFQKRVARYHRGHVWLDVGMGFAGSYTASFRRTSAKWWKVQIRFLPYGGIGGPTIVILPETRCPAALSGILNGIQDSIPPLQARLNIFTPLPDAFRDAFPTEPFHDWFGEREFHCQ